MSSENRNGDQAVEVVFFVVPCRHAEAGMPHDGTVSDYERLSRDEVAALLDQAARAQGDWQTVAKLQCRLERAVPGTTCPRQAGGPAAERETRLDELFAARYREGGTAELTGAVWSILTEGPAGNEAGPCPG
jgi:hypothetical protein